MPSRRNKRIAYKPSEHFKIHTRPGRVHAFPETLRSTFLNVLSQTLNPCLFRALQIIFFTLVSIPISAKTVFTTEHVFTPSNSSPLEPYPYQSFFKIGPNHALFISQTSTRNDAEKDIFEVYVLDARTKNVIKKTEVNVYEPWVKTTKAGSKAVWVDILGNLFLADSVTGDIRFIKDFGAAYAGSLGPWQSCLGFGEEIFVVNNFSYLRISNFCDVDEGEPRLYVYDHKDETLSPIYTNQQNEHIIKRRSFLIIDNPRKSDASAIAVSSGFPHREQDPPPVEFWEIEPTSRSLALIDKIQDHFIYSRFRGSAKTSKGVFICDSRRVVRISNSLTINTIPGSSDTGCDKIKEYRDHVFWEPTGQHDQSKLWFSDGTLVSSKSINDPDSSGYLRLGCETWGKLFVRGADSSYQPTAVRYINEAFNSNGINLEATSRVGSCLDNQLVMVDHPKKSIYNLLNSKNTPIKDDKVSTIIQLENRLFALKRKTELDEYDNEVTIGVSINELVEAEFVNLTPVIYLLLSDD